ncbi:hypothetical protein JCM8547_002922 [Rhodosporidiobolus lusitaniae]
MSLAQARRSVERFGAVNTLIVVWLLCLHIPFAASELLAVPLLVGWSLARLFWPRWRRTRWKASTWAVLGVLAARAASFVLDIERYLDLLLPSYLFRISYYPAANPVLVRRLIFELVYRGVVYFTLLCALPYISPMTPLAIPVSVLALVVLPFSSMIFGSATVAVLAYETIKGVYARFLGIPDTIRALLDLRELCERQATTAEQYEARQRQFDIFSTNAGVSPAVEEVLPSHDQAWLDLAALSDADLRLVCQHLDFASSCSPVEDPRFSAVEPKMLAPSFVTIKHLLEASYIRRPSYTQHTSFIDVAYQLAGVVVHYSPLPVPSFLHHLGRPFQLVLVGHFFLTPWVVRYHLHPSQSSTFSSSSNLPILPEAHPFHRFTSLLPPFFLAAQEANVTSANAAQVLGAYLRMVEARERAESEEEKARERVLDEVLLWRERRELGERRREEVEQTVT